MSVFVVTNILLQDYNCEVVMLSARMDIFMAYANSILQFLKKKKNVLKGCQTAPSF